MDVLVLLLATAGGHLDTDGAFWVVRDPGVIKAGEEVTMVFSIEDPLDSKLAWKDLVTMHESKIHFLAVSEAVDEVVHTHPEWSWEVSYADVETDFSVTFTLPKPGWYYLSWSFVPVKTNKLLASYLIFLYNVDSAFWDLKGDELVPLCAAHPPLCVTTTGVVAFNVAGLALKLDTNPGNTTDALWAQYGTKLLNGGFTSRLYVSDDGPALPEVTLSRTPRHTATTSGCFSGVRPCGVWHNATDVDGAYEATLTLQDTNATVTVTHRGRPVPLQRYLSAPGHIYVLPVQRTELVLLGHEHGFALGPLPNGDYTALTFGLTLPPGPLAHVIVQLGVSGGGVLTLTFLVGNSEVPAHKSCCPAGTVETLPGKCVAVSDEAAPWQEDVCGEMGAQQAVLTTPVERSVAAAYLEGVTGCVSWMNYSCWGWVGAVHNSSIDKFVWESNGEVLNTTQEFAYGYVHRQYFDCVFTGGILSGRYASYFCTQHLRHLCTSTCKGEIDEVPDPIGPSHTPHAFNLLSIILFCIPTVCVPLAVVGFYYTRRIPADHPVRLDSAVGSIEMSDTEEANPLALADTKNLVSDDEEIPEEKA